MLYSCWIAVAHDSNHAIKLESYSTPTQVIKHLWKSAAVFEDFSHEWSSLVDWYQRVYATLATNAQAGGFALHCHEIQKQFFDHLFFDESRSELIFVDDASRLPYDHTLVALSPYWQRTGNQAYAMWCAMYFDCVVQLFLTSLCQETQGVDLPIQQHQSAHEYYLQLRELIVLLKDTVYEKRYARQLHRYQELLEYVRIGK